MELFLVHYLCINFVNFGFNFFRNLNFDFINVYVILNFILVSTPSFE